jgi:hypothetical protein
LIFLNYYLTKLNNLYIIHLEVESWFEYFKEMEMFHMANSLLHLSGVAWQKENSWVPENVQPLRLSGVVYHPVAERAFDKLGDGLISLGRKLKESHYLKARGLASVGD